MPNITTFLLVDDDPNTVFLVERVFKQALAHLGFRSVGDGIEAIEYLKREGAHADGAKSPQADVILLDLKMPRLDGFGFLERLRTGAAGRNQLLPVVVMSSSALPQDVVRAYRLGANSYIVKCTNWHQFQERIKLLGIYWAEHVEKPSGNGKL